jgi:hypothetical protein
MQSNTPSKESIRACEIWWHIFKDLLVTVLAVAPLRDKELPKVEPLRIATSVGVKFGPCELALLVRFIVSLSLDFFLADYVLWRFALHGDRKRLWFHRFTWNKRRSIDVDV